MYARVRECVPGCVHARSLNCRVARLQDRLTYSITSDARCQDVFYVAADTGAVFLKKVLLTAPENLFTVS